MKTPHHSHCYAALPNTAHTCAQSRAFRGRYCHFCIINETQIAAQAMEALLPAPERPRSHLLDVFLLKPARAHSASATPGLISEKCLPAQSKRDSSASNFSNFQLLPRQNWGIAAVWIQDQALFCVLRMLHFWLLLALRQRPASVVSSPCPTTIPTMPQHQFHCIVWFLHSSPDLVQASPRGSQIMKTMWE